MSIGAYTGAPSSNGMTGIRKYLNDQGYNDNQITYNNGVVSLNGKSFYNATPSADGSTYAPQSALQSALKQYNSANNSSMANNLNSSLYNNVTSQPFQFKQQQPAFSYDPNSDQAYQAALKSAQQNIQTGQNNTLANLLAHGQGNSSYAASAAQQIANKEMGNVANNILPSLISQAYQRYQDQNQNDYRNQLANYNASQDQFRNQSALSNYLNGLGQQDFNNNLATNQDQRAQSAQDANFTGYYSNPNTSAIQRAMQSNSDAYATASPEEQQRLHAENVKLAASIGGTDTTGNGDYAYGPMRTLAGQNQDFNQQLGLGNQKIAQQNADTQKASEEATAKYRDAEAARQYALASGQIGASKQSNNNYAIQNLLNVWEKTGVAPSGLESLGVQPGTPIASKGNSSKQNDYKNNSKFSEDVAYIKNNPNAASLLNSNAKQFIDEYGIDGYNELRKQAGLKDNE